MVNNLDKALDKFPPYTDEEPLNRSLLFMYEEDAEKIVSDALEKGYIQEKSYTSRRAILRQSNTVFIMLKIMLEW